MVVPRDAAPLPKAVQTRLSRLSGEAVAVALRSRIMPASMWPKEIEAA